MRYSFVALERLLETDPDVFFEETRRMREEDLDRLERFVTRTAKQVSSVLGVHRRHSSMRALILGEAKAPRARE